MRQAEATSGPSISEIVSREIERAIQRNIKGLEFFRVGDPPVAQTPKDIIYKRGTLELSHYRPVADEIYRVPLMLVMSLVSKPYIFDLGPGQSLIEFLLNHGYDVYMIDWGVPRLEDRRLKLEDYCLDFIPDCANRMADDSGEKDFSLMGYCMGGTLALIYAGLFPTAGLKNLICLTTPVNYDGMGMFRIWSDKKHFDVDRIVDTLGNVPAEMMYNSFQMLRPATRMISQIRLWDNMWNDEFVKSYRLLERWGNDQIPFPGECFRQNTKELMWENKLYKNELVLGGRRVDLRQIRASCLNIIAQHDDIAPFEATKEVNQLVGSEDKEDMVLKGGHVSVLAGPNASKRMWPALDRWLGERST
jgi:polyhydroxyalkanoate synthase